MEVYVYERMVTLWGDIPYTEALDVENILPKYDDALTIYQDLLTRLDNDIANMDLTAASFGTADIIYGGDVPSWIKFANSLKVKMGVVLSTADAATAGTAIQTGMAGAFTSNADNASVTYLSSTPNTNPLYVDLTLSGRQDFIGTTIITDYMNPLNDSRMSAYFTYAPGTSEYLGGVYGASNPYTGFSHVGTEIATDPTFPCTILSYVEVEFYLAEAAARGLINEDVETHYNAGITASFDFWGVDGAADYITTTDVAYTTAAGTWEQKIGTQAWIAFYNNGYLGWTEYRRLGYPTLPMPPSPAFNITEIPTRFTYPVFEQTLNADSYNAAASAIGGDLLTTKLFFTKN